MKRKNRAQMRAPQAGFTLIEIMIAMAVMLFGIVSLISLQMASISATGNAYRMAAATGLAHDGLERMSRLDFYTDQLLADVIDPQIDPAAMLGPWVNPCNCTSDPLDLLNSVDGTGVQVNAFGNVDPNLGPLTFTRTHWTRFVNPSLPSRIEIFCRVTWFDPNSGKRHGVTVSTVRAKNRFSP